MKSIITTMGICALLAGATHIVAQEENKAQEETNKTQNPEFKSKEAKEVKATVEKVDKDTREVTLKKDDGTSVTIKAPDTVRNFDQIKVGDMVTAKYSQSIAVAVRKSDEPPSATGRETFKRAPLGEKPAAAGTSMTQISATIDKIDKDKRELTLKGPQGNSTVVKVSDDVKRFDELKEGDQVVITATESLAISVSSPENKEGESLEPTGKPQESKPPKEQP
jgi:hypothetical protein